MSLESAYTAVNILKASTFTILFSCLCKLQFSRSITVQIEGHAI